MTARTYTQSKRAEQAGQTRARILDAACALVAEDGFAGASMAAIAERAGVARNTVFQQFESKLGLLRAMEAQVSQRAGIDSLREQLDQPDARRALDAAFRFGAQVWARERVLFRKLFGLALVDPEVALVMSEKSAGRRKLCEVLAARLESQSVLAPGWDKKRARDALWLLTSFESFDAIHAGRDAAYAAELLLALSSVMVRRPNSR